MRVRCAPPPAAPARRDSIIPALAPGAIRREKRESPGGLRAPAGWGVHVGVPIGAPKTRALSIQFEKHMLIGLSISAVSDLPGLRFHEGSALGRRGHMHPGPSGLGNERPAAALSAAGAS